MRSTLTDSGELELGIAVAAVASAISAGLGVDELTLLSSVLVQLADTLATIAARRSLSE